MTAIAQRVALLGAHGVRWKRSVHKVKVTPRQYVELAEKLAKGNGGTLPSPWWLRRNDHKGLDYCMRKYPKLFAHIPQERATETSDWYVKQAEELTKKNRGVLPSSWRLRNDGHHLGLNDYMIKHPELFAHIPRSRRAA